MAPAPFSPFDDFSAFAPGLDVLAPSVLFIEEALGPTFLSVVVRLRPTPIPPGFPWD